MNGITNKDSGLFEHAPRSALRRKRGLIQPDELNVARRALLAASIGWVPIVLLTLAESAVQRSERVVSLLRETGVHVRCLIAVPLLMLAERECAAQLNAIRLPVRLRVDMDDG